MATAKYAVAKEEKHWVLIIKPLFYVIRIENFEKRTESPINFEGYGRKNANFDEKKFLAPLTPLIFDTRILQIR